MTEEVKLPVPRKRRWIRLLNIVLVIYLLVGVAVYFLQNRFLFHPETISKDKNFNFSISHKEVNIALDGDYNMNVVQFLTNDSTAKGVVLYFHGNRKNIEWYAGYAPTFTGKGYEVWMIDYPGYGKSYGKLTEQKLYDYAEQLYIMAKAKYNADSIIIYGKSLGTGIAAWLASKKTAKRVILETPYYSIPSLVSHYLPIYPVSRILKYQLPTYAHINIINAPISIFHGTSDNVIPYSNAEKLKPLLNTKDEFITIPDGEHNNLSEFPLFREKLDSLLAL
ncbi:MAG: alpha/beta fold hydrolase [Chitinophagaceae bacterium]|nr:alpha/beta fold hydrolase [Chitinophagaceae bacterium]